MSTTLKPRINLARLSVVIDVMERVKANKSKLRLGLWLETLSNATKNIGFAYQLREKGQSTPRTEEEANRCGTGACVLGWTALSPEFQAAGGKVSRGGDISFKGRSKASAMAAFLECSISLAKPICALASYDNHEFPSFDYRFQDIDRVLFELNKLKAVEIDYRKEKGITFSKEEQKALGIEEPKQHVSMPLFASLNKKAKALIGR